MKSDSCLNCANADWYRTKTGKLHPNGQGKCTWKMPVIEIPKAFYYMYEKRTVPSPTFGGAIDRKDPHTDCPCWVPLKDITEESV
jgi:hypothetical protein